MRRKPTMNSFVLKLYVRFQGLACREEGQEVVEYALIVALISFGGVIGMRALAGALDKVFVQISSTLGGYTT
jgi:Flp pilus assembly pilin Flp